MQSHNGAIDTTHTPLLCHFTTPLMSCLFPYISYKFHMMYYLENIVYIFFYIRVRISRPEQSFQQHHSLTTAATPTVSGELYQEIDAYPICIR
jgi:hypothetical protein